MTTPSTTIDTMIGTAPVSAGRLLLAALLSLVVHVALLVGLAAVAVPGRFGLPVVPVLPGPVIVARLAPVPPTEPAVAPPPVIVVEAPPPAPSPPPAAPVVAPPPAPAAQGVPQPPPHAPTEGIDVTVRTLFDAGKLPGGLGRGLAADYPARPGRFPGPNKVLALSYPETALRDRHGGSVHVLLHLDATGSVVRSSFDPEDSEFAPTVRDALAELRFIPAQLGGAPIPYWIAFEITFSIAGGAPR